MSIDIRIASVNEQAIIKAMLPQYLAEIGAGSDYPYFDLYWTTQKRSPYLFLIQEKVVGFCFVRYLTDENVFEMAEFYIKPEFRGNGLGRLAARTVLSKHPGTWQLSVFSQNKNALHFWESVIGKFIGLPPIIKTNDSGKHIFNFEVSNEELPVRNSVKLLLLNPENKLLLMCTDDKSIQSKDGKYNGKFWHLIGGKIEDGETIEQGALRELNEETDLAPSAVQLECVAWYGEIDLNMQGVLTRIKQSFMVVRTNGAEVSLQNLTEEEKPVTKHLRWFSLDEIRRSDEIIYPVVLTDYLPDIIDGKYPSEPITIDLTKQPVIRATGIMQERGDITTST